MVTVVYKEQSDVEQLKKILPSNTKYIDILSKKGKKEGWKLKNYYGAKLDPFAVIIKDNKTIKAFYSEAENIINSLNTYFNMQVKVVNISNNQLPKYESKGAAGLDIRIDLSRVTPDKPIKAFGDAEVIWAGEAHSVPMVRIAPRSRALLPTGLFTAIPEGYQISLRPRSGLSIKQGVTLCNAVGLIDCDYRSEILVPVINLGLEDVYIEDGERVCQALLEKVNKIEWEEVESLDETERKGGFGSTGIK